MFSLGSRGFRGDTGRRAAVGKALGLGKKTKELQPSQAERLKGIGGDLRRSLAFSTGANGAGGPDDGRSASADGQAGGRGIRRPSSRKGLYRLTEDQVSVLTYIHAELLAPFVPASIVGRELLKSIWKFGKANGTMSEFQLTAAAWKDSLGFASDDPAFDIADHSAGRLAVRCIEYMAHHHTAAWRQLLADTAEAARYRSSEAHPGSYPVSVTAADLAKALCDQMGLCG
eukprot:g4282.t1